MRRWGGRTLTAAPEHLVNFLIALRQGIQFLLQGSFVHGVLLFQLLTEQRFFRMTETLEQEQADNKARMQAITDELRSASDTGDAVRIVRSAFSQFKQQNRNMSTINILRSPKFNQLVESHELRSASDTEDDVRRFIGEIREYASITELDETILNRLIDKIIADGSAVHRTSQNPARPSCHAQ